jgi:hypothetical protein
MARETTSEEHNRHLAELCDQRAAAFEAELDSTNDARLRHELGEQIRQERETAAFYREQGAKLQSEA